MAGSSFGNIYRITTFGESHGKALGCIIDGCPAGLSLDEADIQKFLDRRKPGTSEITTQRKESDTCKIYSGVFEGKTTGAPIMVMVENTDQRSHDYSEIASYYRPGHADFTFDEKYGFRDYRGGGRSSGRETIGRVIGGAVAMKLLDNMGIRVYAYTKSIGDVFADCATSDIDLRLQTKTAMPDISSDEKALRLIEKARKSEDSLGGIIECVAENVPAGLGDPVFEKLDGNLSKAVMSIGAVKAVEIGDGIMVSSCKGSENNDEFVAENGVKTKATNHSGGILGGISDGSKIVLRAHIKPTPSVSKTQHTVNKDNENIEISIKGRHDPVIVPRAVVVVECMTAMTLLDALLLNMSARADRVMDFYRKI